MQYSYDDDQISMVYVGGESIPAKTVTVHDGCGGEGHGELSFQEAVSVYFLTSIPGDPFDMLIEVSGETIRVTDATLMGQGDTDCNITFSCASVDVLFQEQSV